MNNNVAVSLTRLSNLSRIIPCSNIITDNVYYWRNPLLTMKNVKQQRFTAFSIIQFFRDFLKDFGILFWIILSFGIKAIFQSQAPFYLIFKS